jgi:glycine cleavage system protein P-like pyridoxal-binding family
MLLGKSGNTLKGVLPNAVTVARMATPRPNTSERSLTSPRIQIYEGLVYMMKNVLVSLDKLDMAYNSTSQEKKVWIRKDETIHPLRGNGLT